MGMPDGGVGGMLCQGIRPWRAHAPPDQQPSRRTPARLGQLYRDLIQPVKIAVSTIVSFNQGCSLWIKEVNCRLGGLGLVASGSG